MPLDGAVVRVQRQTRGGIQVVARTQVRVPGRRVAGAEEQQVGVGVVIATEPRRGATGLPQVARPGLAGLAAADAVLHRLAVLVDIAHVAFDGRTAPQHLAVLRIVGLDLADHAEFATGHAGDQLAVDHQRRGGDRITGLVVGHALAPDHLAGVLVQGDQLGVQGAEDHQVVVQRHATVDHVAARADVVRQARLVLPQLTARARIDGEHPRVGRGDVHHAVLDHRLRLLATLLLAAEGHGPHRAQLLDVLLVEDVQRAVALALQAEAIGDDLVGGGGVLENLGVGDRQRGGGRHQHRCTQRGEEEGLAKTGTFHCGYLCGFIVIAGKFSRSAANSWPDPAPQQLHPQPIFLVPW